MAMRYEGLNDDSGVVNINQWVSMVTNQNKLDDAWEWTKQNV